MANLPPHVVANLYGKRWRIEEVFKIVNRGLYHFIVAYNKGEAIEPVKYFSAPGNRDLGIVKQRRKPRMKLIIAPFPDRQKNQENFFFENPLTPCFSA